MSKGKLTAVEIPKSPPVTLEQLLPMQFAAVKEFKGLSQEERIEHAHCKIDALRPIAVIAGEILANDKDELIEKVEANYDLWGPFLMSLHEASEDARALMQILSSAECRLAVAIAFVEGDDGGGDGEHKAA
jgi:hypothetical protein